MADLKTELESKVLKRTHDRSTVEPILVQRLVDEVGELQKAASLIGYTPSGLSQALRNGKVTETAEVAARGVLERLCKECDRQILVKAAPDKAEMLLAFLKAVGIAYVDLDEL